jgi:putative ABC transport system permease protein
MARRYWPGESAIGKTFRSRASDGLEFLVVGVSGDHKVTTVSESPTPFIQFARDQQTGSYSALIARTRGDADALLRDMQRELLALEPNLVFVEHETMKGEVAATLFPVRAGALIVTGVGTVAMLLAAIGLYGVIAFSVTRRTREIGIRLALGADARSILWPVLRGALAIAAAGAGVGVLLSVIAGRVVRAHFPGVSALDPASFAFAFAALVAAALLAVWRPAVRAIGIDPIVALRGG